MLIQDFSTLKVNSLINNTKNGLTSVAAALMTLFVADYFHTVITEACFIFAILLPQWPNA